MLTRKIEPWRVHPSTFFILSVTACADARRAILTQLDQEINSGAQVFPDAYGKALDKVFKIERQCFTIGGKIN